MKKCILLTATITPNNVPNLKRIDKEQREDDYIEAVKFYLQFNLPIVFCENSNTKSKRILEILKTSKTKFEYLTFVSKMSIEGKGKGEAEILTYAFLNSDIIKNSTNIVKITGRYKVRNFLKQIKNIHKDSIYVNVTTNLCYADSRFFILNNFFYDNYYAISLKKIDENKGVFMEHVLLSATLNYIADFNKWSLLNEKSIYDGVYGTDNTKYSNNILKLFLKKVFYRFKIYIFKSNF